MNSLIHGITHCSFFCNDFEKMVSFYRDTLELPAVFTLRNEDGTPWLTYLKVSDRQFVELFNTKYTGDNKWGTFSMGHFSLLVKDIYAAVSRAGGEGRFDHGRPFREQALPASPLFDGRPARLLRSMTAWVQDPEGNEIELMQYTPASMQTTCLN